MLFRSLHVLALPGARADSHSVLGPLAGHDEQRALQFWVPDLAERDVFLCGPTAWARGLELLVLAAGVPADRIHTETFGW